MILKSDFTSEKSSLLFEDEISQNRESKNGRQNFKNEAWKFSKGQIKKKVIRFERQKAAAMDPLLKDIFYLVIRDEARHVTFGVNYLEEFVATLSDKEREDRAEFAYEACVVMRNRFGSDNVMKHYGWNVEEAQEVLNQSENAKLFNNLLFAKIMPNLKRIGLLTEKTQEKYEEMDILQFQDLEDHGNIDWDELSQPLEYSSKTA